MTQPRARIVHRSRGRMRLRVPQKRKDTPFFLALYDDLRQAPAVEEITMNPTTGSILVHFDEDEEEILMDTLSRNGLIELAEEAVATPDAQTPEDSMSGRLRRFLNGRGSSHTGPRTIVFLIMLGISVYQIRKGQFLGPALTILVYAIDLMVGFLRETDSEDPSAPAARS